MKTSCLILFFILRLLKTGDADPHNEVPLWTLSEDGDIGIAVNLERIHSFLANEHLPVWIVNDQNPYELIPLKNIMKDIGPIHMYQDINNCAAAVHFQKGQYFDGTIDQRYAIKNYNPDINSELTEGLNLFTSRVLAHPNEHRNLDGGISPDEVQMKHGKNWRHIKSRMEDPKIVYVETLVVVNYDIVAAFQNDYKALVSEMLVTFNSVDMIFASIDGPKIKINVAGIIIGNARYSFPLIGENCYFTNERMNTDVLNLGNVNELLKQTLDTYGNTIPINSYDVVVFLTNYQLFDIRDDAGENDEPDVYTGYATPPDHDEYIGYTLSSADMRICAVRHFHNFQHFVAVAHEIAHLLNVWHDPGKFRSFDEKCIGNLMRTNGTYCQKCISFVDASIRQMKRFFRSRDGCKFRNEPRSLNDPSKPQLFWNEHKQCQCYGFVMAKKPQKIDCKSRQRLKCLDGAGNNLETGFFMDGTLCNQHKNDRKVCWNGNCQHIIN